MADARLADALLSDELARARAMDPWDKLLEGPRLFERTWRVMADGIRHEQPGLDEAEVLRRVGERLALADALQRS